MCEITLQDDLNYLTNSTQNIIYDNSSSSSSSNSSNSWEIHERKERIKEAINQRMKKLEEEEDFLLTTWEDMKFNNQKNEA